jgi:hypothetical protein
MERAGWIWYFYLFEVDHAIAPFSLLVALIFYAAQMRRLFGLVACRRCLYFLGVFLFYGTFFVVMVLYRYVFGVDVEMGFDFYMYALLWDLVLIYAV